MSVSTSVSQPGRLSRSHRLVIVSALAAVIAVAAWAIATYAAGSDGRSPQHTASTQASALSVLTPTERHYVLGIVALTPAQVAAAFGTGERSATESLTPQERRYVQAVVAMSRSQQAAAFGTGK